MLFPTHLVAASLVTLRWRLPPGWAVAGAALPDAIDKTVAMAGFYDLYHSVGHSLLAVAVLAVVARADGRAVLALWVGWTTHLLLDALHMVVNGRPADVLFLAWPLVEHVPAVSLPPVEFARYYVGTPSFFLELFVWGAFAAVVVERLRARRARSAP